MGPNKFPKPTFSGYLITFLYEKTSYWIESHHKVIKITRWWLKVHLFWRISINFKKQIDCNSKFDFRFACLLDKIYQFCHWFHEKNRQSARTAIFESAICENLLYWCAKSLKVVIFHWFSHSSWKNIQLIQISAF